jgi:predicted nucleotidyltransferase
MINFNSVLTQKLLDYYFLNTRAKHYINELAKVLKTDPGNLDRKLKELEKEGLFFSQKQGNQKYFSLNPKYPFLKETKKIYEGQFGLTKMLAQIFKKLKGLEAAYIFGSYAKNKLGPESDIDILLIGKHSSLEAQKLISPLEKKFHREFNIVDMAEKEFNKRKKNKDEFLDNVFKNKMIKLI